MNHYTEQFERYSDATLAFTLADCYETLHIGAGVHGNAYIAKLWSQIDAIYDIQSRRSKKPKTKKPSHETRNLP